MILNSTEKHPDHDLQCVCPAEVLQYPEGTAEIYPGDVQYDERENIASGFPNSRCAERYTKVPNLK